VIVVSWIRFITTASANRERIARLTSEPCVLVGVSSVKRGILRNSEGFVAACDGQDDGGRKIIRPRILFACLRDDDTRRPALREVIRSFPGFPRDPQSAR
jgi:hypothetical protein